MNEPTSTPAPVPRGWGLQVSSGARYHWSARAILRDGTIDLLWDRQGIEGEASAAEKAALASWLNKKALPWMRLAAKGGGFPGGGEDRELFVMGDGFKLRANPRASHGYLYMSAAPCPEAKGKTPVRRTGRAKRIP